MRVLLGLSGGVDSTAAALLLQQAGYEVTGLFFDVLGNQKALAERAEAAAAQLGISFLYRNVSEEFADRIIDDFCDSYLRGETPNPCVRCNPLLKFKTLEEEADRIGARWIATGHYARIEKEEKDGIFYVHMGDNRRKDQSYMLYRLPQRILSRLLLPLGSSPDKEQVRELLRGQGLSNAEDKDSQEICFISRGNYIDYIKSRGRNSQPGAFVDQEGKVLGQHQGIIHYTIGQRKGLGMTFGKPMFVTALDPLKNTVTLGSNEDLFHKIVMVNNCRFAVDTTEDAAGLPEAYRGIQVEAKIRYAAQPAAARLQAEGDGLVRVEFRQAQRAPTPGQSVVFYQGERCLGGGMITVR